MAHGVADVLDGDAVAAHDRDRGVAALVSVPMPDARAAGDLANLMGEEGLGVGIEGEIVSLGGGVGRGVPVPPGMTIGLPDGQFLEIRHAAAPGAKEFSVTNLQAVSRREFAYCPICLAPNPDSKEHVPQRSVGGQVMTSTCAACNNELGSKVESEFSAWCLDAFVGTRASGSAAPGRRRLPPVYRRETRGGQFVLLVDGSVDPAVRAILDAEKFTFEFRPPSMPLVRVAALKHAYLAACMAVGDIPDSEAAVRVREYLVSVRDAAAPLLAAEASDAAAALRLARSFLAPGPHSVQVGRNATSPDDLWVVLAGVVAVSWPLPDVRLDDLA